MSQPPQSPPALWARSYTVRAVLSLGFLVAFYGLSLGLALGLLAAPVLEWMVLGSLHLTLAALCVAGGVGILWGVFPRREPWVDPGRRVVDGEHPRLFALIAEVSAAMGVHGPAEVYLVPEVNAFVTQRGGFLGFGSRRVLGLGVPLLAVTTVSQLKAVIAHELGHYAGGETRLSGLIYATRAAMVRTLDTLARRGSRVLSRPFEWMLSAYLRLTQAISRQQELMADEWAVRVGGREAHAATLQAVALHSIGFDGFLREDVEPLAAEGVGPDNVYEGYRRFLGSTGWRKALPGIEEAVRQRPAEPFDSHPSLAERLAWAMRVEARPVANDPRGAFELLESGPALERSYTDQLRPEGHRAVSWDEVGTVWQGIVRRGAWEAQSRCPGLSANEVVRAVASAESRRALAERLDPTLVGYRAEDVEQARRRAVTSAVHTWLATVLMEHGWALQVQPGERLQLACAGVPVDTLALAEALYDGEQPGAALEALVASAGLAMDQGVAVPAEERARLQSPRAEVALTPGDGFVEVKAPLGRTTMPVCCAACLGPADVLAEVTFPVEKSGRGDSAVHFGLWRCSEHEEALLNAFTVLDYVPESDEVTLRVPNAALAALLRAVNR